MGCPCEILIDSVDSALTESLINRLREEVWRIEKKWSRYIDGSVVEEINRRAGELVCVDAETARMIDFATIIFQLSDGVFDISSGVLRKVWQFDGRNIAPTPEAVSSVMSDVGWHRVDWQSPRIKLETGMQLDFGGLGKEYAVDQCIGLLKRTEVPVLVNLGGDLACTRAPLDRDGWVVGLDSYAKTGSSRELFSLSKGAVASSGDTYRYVKQGDKRYSHILDARTGWPVSGAPSSVTVMADTCTTAGMLTTLALTHGQEAEIFLADQGVEYRVEW